MVTAEDLRADLLAARKARDKTVEIALKRALGRIESAEAPPLPPRATALTDQVTEVARLSLSDADRRAALQAEIDEGIEAAAMYEDGGRTDAAQQLRAEVAVLERYLA